MMALSLPLGATVPADPLERDVAVDVDLRPAPGDLALADVVVMALDVAQEAPVPITAILGEVLDQLAPVPPVEHPLHRPRGLRAAALDAAIHLGGVDPDQADVVLVALEPDLDRVSVRHRDD